VTVGDCCEVGLAGDEASHSADGVFDAAFLPRGVGVTEEGLQIEAVQVRMAGEFGAVVEGYGSAQPLGEGLEQLLDQAGDEGCGFVVRPGGEQDARGAFVHGKDGLAVFCEHHEVGFPVPWRLPIAGFGGSLRDGDTAFDEGRRAAAAGASPSAFAFGAREIEPPAIVLGAGDLGVDEAVDGLVADDRSAGLALETASDLLGRPAAGETFKDGAAQVGLAFEARALPAPRPRLLVGERRLIADFAATVALKLASDRRWRAIQSCRDLPDRAPIALKSGNLTPILQRQLDIPPRHGNTSLKRCCTSFVNLGNLVHFAAMVRSPPTRTWPPKLSPSGPSDLGPVPSAPALGARRLHGMTYVESFRPLHSRIVRGGL